MKVVLFKEDPEILSQVSEKVTKFDRKLVDLVNDMFWVTDIGGVGLAAIQLGIPKCVVVVNDKTTGQRTAFINPEITWKSEATEVAQEGCLSAPGEYVNIERHLEVKVSYQNLSGRACEAHLKGFFSRIFQHEYDHTLGLMCVTKGTPV